MPLLFRPDGIQIIITPLNILGEQNTAQLQRLGIRAIAISAKTATAKNFADIGQFNYRVIVVNPEEAFKRKGGFSALWKNRVFTVRLISVVWDEAHCVESWASFRKDYAQSGRLRNLLSSVPYLIPSATLPDAKLSGVLSNLQVPRSRLVTIRRSNDRPNIYLVVRKMRYAVSSFKDLLDILLPEGWKPGDPIPKFLVFFDNIEDSIQAADVLRKFFRAEDRYKVLCFNSDATPTLREQATEEYRAGDLWGLYCTDSFGMGVDIPDVDIVVQWKTTCDLDSLWQRFGRAARGPGTNAVAVLLAEPKFFDEERAAAAKRAEKRAGKKREEELNRAVASEQAKRKRSETVGAASRTDARPTIRPRTMGESNTTAHEERTESAQSEVPSMCQQLRIVFKTSAVENAATAESRVGKGKKASSGNSLSPEMDSLVNAGTRPFRCYRIPINAYYENDMVAFAFLPSTSAVQRPSAPRAHAVDSKYTMTSQDYDLRIALHEFRRAQTLEMYGLAVLNNLGTGMIMGDEELVRIADCARAHHLKTLEDLYRESKWDLTWELGESVLELVNRYYPVKAPLVSTPLQAQQTARDVASVPQGSEASRTSTARRCGACDQVGHTRRSKACPMFAQAKPTNEHPLTDKENTQPAHEPVLTEASGSASSRSSASTGPGPSASTMTRMNSYEDFWNASLFAEPSYRRNVRVIDAAALTGLAARAQTSARPGPPAP
ncbi:hypothetical protein BN946_scf184632.g16 [Trametes cinnabarina]|uniref:DNA 3'-5' helicase n=1 Tax=Pycnoporus cinnabarinus TaxID=5643 RepID=A0A060SQQ2_PYCCI|nr:hypothetical protein BN946_scf184632.g16 [Trametes cinnabarina]